MPITYPLRRHTLFSLLLTAVLLACAEAPKPPPEEAYRQAVEEAKRGHNQEAKRLFEQVRDTDTPVRLEFLAAIGIADALYKDRKYEEAAAEYSHLFDIHSGDAIADYLKYQLGMCYHRRIDTVDRDQGLTHKARSEFMELVTHYPESDLVPAARENLRLCNEFLAKRELYVGNFYFTKGNYRAAKTRYQRGVTEYGRVGAIPELLHRLVLAEDALGDAAAQQTAGRLAAEYPDDPWNQNLAAALEKQRQRRAEEVRGEGLLNRVRHWWSAEEPTAPALGAEGETEGAVHTVGEPSARPATETEEASPIPQPEGHLHIDVPPPVTVAALDAGATAPGNPARWRRFATWLQGSSAAEAETLDTAEPAPETAAEPTLGPREEAPWPGATVAAALPAVATPRPSRWQRFVTWLHGPAAAPAAAPPATSAPAAPAPPGLIVRRIPPVVAEPPAGVAVTPQQEPVHPVTASPAPAVPPPAAAVAVPPPAPTAAPEPSAEPAPATPHAAVPPPEEGPATLPVVAVVPSSAAPVSTAAQVTGMAAPGHGELVMEEFPADNDGEETAMPAVQEESVAPSAPVAAGSAMVAAPPSRPASPAHRPPLAEQVDEAITAAEGGSTMAPPVPMAARPVPTTTEAEAVAVSGQGTRNQPPRPLPLPAYARPTPPPSGELGLVPAAIAGRQSAAAPTVEWRSLTPVERSSPTVEPIGDVALPAIELPAEPPAGTSATPDFWQGLRDAYGRLAQSEP